MKELDIFLYDSFTHALFGGNVAGVVLDAHGLQADTLQRIAAELAAPTTSFVIGGSNATFNVRFFTPTQEIAMCGHVTIAVFTALTMAGRLKFNAAGVSIGVPRVVARYPAAGSCMHSSGSTVCHSTQP
jgi:PhzF family phenazine biosynthesis protein